MNPKETNVYAGNTAKTSNDALAEISTGSDMTLEATEEMRDTIAELNETLYSNKGDDV